MSQRPFRPQTSPPLVVFRVAAGPRLGFGHLVRARALAHALGVRPVLSIRGGTAATRTARSLGCVVPPAPTLRWLAREPVALLVIDDPSHQSGSTWCRAARRAGIPVASVHDRGIGSIATDLVIDGSILARSRRSATWRLLGPRYAILDPSFSRLRPRAPRHRSPVVLITLGGGSRRAGLARLAAAVVRRCPDVTVRLAGGLAPPLHGIDDLTWSPSEDGLHRSLAASDVAIVGGGVTMYEACAVGVPSIAVAVVEAQRPAIHAMSARGAVIDGGRLPAGAWPKNTLDRLADLTGTLIEQPAHRDQLGRAARREVDGRGAFRVARALRSLVRRRYAEYPQPVKGDRRSAGPPDEPSWSL